MTNSKSNTNTTLGFILFMIVSGVFWLMLMFIFCMSFDKVSVDISCAYLGRQYQVETETIDSTCFFQEDSGEFVPLTTFLSVEE